MAIQMRRHVFETNSSSSHSVSYSVRSSEPVDFKQVADDLAPDGIITAQFGDFGWGYDCLSSFDEKLSYVVTEMQYKDGVNRDNAESFMESQYFQWLQQLMRQMLNVELTIEYKGGYFETGYVDHQSIGTLHEADLWGFDEGTFKSNMSRLLFDDGYNIIIDNDNH